MEFTCLTKGRGYHFPPCHMLDIGGFRVLLDCPLDLSALTVFSPIGSNRKLEEISKCFSHVSLGTDPVAPKRQKVERTLDESDLIHAVPCYKTVSSLHLWNVSFINVVLISSPMGMLGLPFLTRDKGFSAKIYATEATVRLGQLMMEDLVSMHREYRQFYGPEELGSPEWMKWDELENLPPALKEIVLGKEGTELGSWLPLYSAADLKDCIQRVQSVKYAEEACYNGTLIIKAFSSGLDIGTSNWAISSPKSDVIWLSGSLFVSNVALNFDYHALQDHDIILYSDFSFLDSLKDSDADIDHSPSRYNNDQGAPTDPLIDLDDNSEEEEKIAFIYSCVLDSVKAGGSVLVPFGRLGVILQLLDLLLLSEELANLKVPILMVSPVSEELLSFTSIIPEWLSKQRQEKLFTGVPLFAHTKFLREKRLHLFPGICSPELFSIWKEPCIVLCTHWSLRLGPVLHFLRRWREDGNSLLVLEDGVDADLALLPFKPMVMKVLQCSFLSGIRLKQVLPLMKKLRSKLVVFPEELSKVIVSPNDTSFSSHSFSENETIQIPTLKHSTELEIGTNLASQFHWRNLTQFDINVTRLNGDLLMEHGKHRLVLGNDMEDASHRSWMMHWGSVDLGRLLTMLQTMGIDGSVVQATSDASGSAFVVDVREPKKALIEVQPTKTIISATEEGFASRIFEALDSGLDGI